MQLTKIEIKELLIPIMEKIAKDNNIKFINIGVSDKIFSTTGFEIKVVFYTNNKRRTNIEVCKEYIEKFKRLVYNSECIKLDDVYVFLDTEINEQTIRIDLEMDVNKIKTSEECEINIQNQIQNGISLIFNDNHRGSLLQKHINIPLSVLDIANINGTNDE